MADTKAAGILDVISGKESIKISVSIDTTTIAILVVGVFVAVLAGIFISKQIS